MHKDLIVNKSVLEKEQDVWSYLYIILDKYIELQEKEPEYISDNFNNDQHALFAYMILDSQVCNGGFIQLIYNGYGSLIFESPFIETLEEWGISATASLLKEVCTIYEKVGISQGEDDTLDDFSDLYEKYPQFDEFDDSYYNIMEEEVRRAKLYVENHLDLFITLE